MPFVNVGADPNALDRSGVSPLHRAVRTLSPGQVRSLFTRVVVEGAAVGILVVDIVVAVVGLLASSVVCAQVRDTARVAPAPTASTAFDSLRPPLSPRPSYPGSSARPTPGGPRPLPSQPVRPQQPGGPPRPGQYPQR